MNIMTNIRRTVCAFVINNLLVGEMRENY